MLSQFTLQLQKIVLKQTSAMHPAQVMQLNHEKCTVLCCKDERLLCLSH